MKQAYICPISIELIQWAKVENNHKKALKLQRIADKMDDYYRKYNPEGRTLSDLWYGIEYELL